ncbi:MAG: DUF11 domain-containing protein [Dehalococcoidia bacterium]|nr:DUF11 domain-containing protein [Dehalococcoidia bacterium]
MQKHSFLTRVFTLALIFLLSVTTYLPTAGLVRADEPEDDAAVAAASQPNFLDDSESELAKSNGKKKGNGDKDRGNDDSRKDDRNKGNGSSSAQRAFIGDVKVKGGSTLLIMDRSGRTALAYVTESTKITARDGDHTASFNDITVGMRVSVYGLSMDASQLPHLASAELQTHRDGKSLTVIEARRITLPATSSGAGVTVGVVRAISASFVTVMGIDGHDHTASLTGAIILSETPVVVGDLVVLIAHNVNGTLTALMLAKLGGGGGGGGGGGAMTLSKTPDSGTVSVGSLATFTTVLTNTSGAPLNNVTLTDTLPGGLTWFENPDNTSCTISGNTNLSCSFGTLNAGNAQTVTVSAVTTSATTLASTATATASNASSVSDSGSIIVGSGGGTPTLSINDTAVTEGNSGTASLNFTVTLSAPTPVGGVTFDIATADGSATIANNDYQAKNLPGQTIAASNSSYSFSVLVNGDTTVEPSETVLVNVTNVLNATIADGQGIGTVTNDDSASLPALSINNVTDSEGNSGVKGFSFSVTLSAPAPAGGVTFDIATADGTALAGTGDYVAKSQTSQSIAAGNTTYTFEVLVIGNATNEPAETFVVNVTNVTNATIAAGPGQGTINNDD